MRDLAFYLAGVLTPFLVYFGYVAAEDFAAWFMHEWRPYSCAICNKGGGNLPLRTLRLRVHCRAWHGLAFTVRARARKKQWHGLSLWFALTHGCPSEEAWRQACDSNAVPRSGW